MIPLILAGLALLIMAVIGSIFVYRNITYKWLEYALTTLVVSLPFEQLPSISAGGGTIKIGQILTLLSVYFAALLALKKDPRVLAVKLNYFFYATLAFFVVSIPSWFFVNNYKRFLITIIPTLIVFLAANLLAHFLQNPIKALRLLLISLFISCVFGAYQFVGDLVGLPYTVTLLSERYTKIVFGFPRIHSTAIEPLYFAGMLFYPIISFFVFWLSHTDILPAIKLPPFAKNTAMFLFFLVFLIATISKSAVAIAFLVLGLVFVAWFIKYPTLRTASDLVIVGGAGMIALYVFIMFSPALDQWTTTIIEHVVDTVSGTSASFQEREIFLETASELLPAHYLLGIGSGNYGVIGEHLLRFLPKQENGGYYIVNNAYIEVLLEYGLLSFLVFIATLGRVLLGGISSLKNTKSWLEAKSLYILIVTFSLVAYFIQWLTFSPVYIMPIFILMGTLINLTSGVREDGKDKASKTYKQPLTTTKLRTQ